MIDMYKSTDKSAERWARLLGREFNHTIVTHDIRKHYLPSDDKNNTISSSSNNFEIKDYVGSLASAIENERQESTKKISPAQGIKGIVEVESTIPPYIEVSEDLTSTNIKNSSPYIVPKDDTLFISKIEDMILADTFVIGYCSKTAEYLREEIRNNKLRVIQALGEVLRKGINQRNIQLAILHIFSELDFEDVAPNALYMVATLAGKQDDYVNEMAIAVFEKWNNIDALNFLKEMRITSNRLIRFRNKIVARMEMELL